MEELKYEDLDVVNLEESTEMDDLVSEMDYEMNTIGESDDDSQLGNDIEYEELEEVSLVTRDEEIKYEDVNPTLVLTPNFLKARETIKQSESNESDETLVTTNNGLSTIYMCSSCNVEFSSEAEAKLHLLDHKFDSKGKKCNHCSMIFKSRHFYEKHIESVHKNIQFVCQVCGKILASRIQWRSHLRNHDKTLKYRCTFEDCTKAFRCKHHLDNHIRVHIKDSPFICNAEGCTARFRQKYALTTHMRKHSGQFVFCSKCESPFVTQFRLNKHFEKCIGVFKPLVTRTRPCEPTERLKCAIGMCNEIFKSKGMLDTHLAKSHGLDFICNICSVRLKNSENLKSHMTKYHANESGSRMHTCDFCSASFKRNEHLRNHIAFKHSNESSFSCDICSYTALSRHDLKSHLKQHSKGAFDDN